MTDRLGLIEPITKELPLEYAVELNRLVQLQMEGPSAKARPRHEEHETMEV